MRYDVIFLQREYTSVLKTIAGLNRKLQYSSGDSQEDAFCRDQLEIQRGTLATLDEAISNARGIPTYKPSTELTKILDVVGITLNKGVGISVTSGEQRRSVQPDGSYTKMKPSQAAKMKGHIK